MPKLYTVELVRRARVMVIAESEKAAHAEGLVAVYEAEENGDDLVQEWDFLSSREATDDEIREYGVPYTTKHRELNPDDQNALAWKKAQPTPLTPAK